MPGGRIDVVNVPIIDLIVNAWHVLPFQIFGAPSWVKTARYDISAKPEKPPKPSDVKLMLKALLMESFGLAVQRETRNLPIYALVIAEKDGKLGPSLTQSTEGSCTAHDPEMSSPVPVPGKPSSRWCGLLMMQPRRLNGAGVSVSSLAEQLSLTTGRHVTDMTGLKGYYDINLQWTSDEGQLPIPDQPKAASPSDPSGQSLFAALRGQLGVKLESTKGPVEVIVIDHVERPSPN
jgi:uncharacterized protein (TIGR03435 family)